MHNHSLPPRTCKNRDRVVMFNRDSPTYAGFIAKSGRLIAFLTGYENDKLMDVPSCILSRFVLPGPEEFATTGEFGLYRNSSEFGCHDEYPLI